MLDQFDERGSCKRTQRSRQTTACLRSESDLFSQAAECFKKCLSWMERQNTVDPVQVMQLRRMMDFAMRSRYKTLKQTTVLHFFRNDE